jgi:NTE family protein
MSSVGTPALVRPHSATGTVARSRRPYTAFVFSGGSSLGALQVGMLAALYERGISADVLVGTSMGSLNAAFVASRPQTAATAGELARVWSDIHREDVFPVSVRALVAGLCGQRDHLVPDRALRREVRRHVEFEDLSDARIPMHLVAFDVIEGREALLSQGPVVDAIAASAALPGLFPPVPIGERLLIDGSVVNNTPISHAVELGAERIYVLPTQERWHPLGRAPRGALDTALNALDLLVEGRLRADLARYSSEAELIVLPAPNSLQVQPTDFDHARHLIGEAHAAGRDLLTRRGTTHRRLTLLATSADGRVSRERHRQRRPASKATPRERKSDVDAHV